MLTRITYICEGCDSVYNKFTCIENCSFCPNEICISCQKLIRKGKVAICYICFNKKEYDK